MFRKYLRMSTYLVIYIYIYTYRLCFDYLFNSLGFNTIPWARDPTQQDIVGQQTTPLGKHKKANIRPSQCNKKEISKNMTSVCNH